MEEEENVENDATSTAFVMNRPKGETKEEKKQRKALAKAHKKVSKHFLFSIALFTLISRNFLAGTTQ